MKYLTVPKPTQEEFYRIHETMFYFLVRELEERGTDVQRILHGLAIIADVSTSQITLAASRITEPLIEPTKIDIAVTYAYIQMPVRSLKYIHHRTYYKYVYNYLDLESQEPRIYNRFNEETDKEIIKLINYIRNNFHLFDILKMKVTYDANYTI